MTSRTGTGPLSRVSARVYRENAFRISGLPPTCSGRDIRRKSDMLAVIEKTGARLPTPDVLPPRPASTAAELRAALDRLADPQQRLVDEFFWFWPVTVSGGSTSGEPPTEPGVGGPEDGALAALAAGDPDAAVRLWTAAAEGGAAATAKDRSHAVHNLAVFEHLRALDAELEARPDQGRDARARPDPGAQPGTSPGGAQPGPGQGTRSGGTAPGPAPDPAPGPGPDWESVYRRWGAALDDDGIWASLAARVRETADARLDERLAATIRALLPETLLTIGAELAVGDITAGARARAERQLTAMRGARLGRATEHALTTALRTAASPWADELSRQCDEILDATASARRTGLEQAERLLVDCAPALERLDLLLPAEESTRVRTRDKVALDTLRCLLFFDEARKLDEASDDDTARQHIRMTRALDTAEQIAASAAVRERLAENRRILESASLHYLCWLCGTNPSESRAAIEIAMHGNVVRRYPEVSWQQAKVTVPRCAACENRGSSRLLRTALRGLLYFVVLLSVPLLLLPGSGGGFLFLCLLIATALISIDIRAVSVPASRREQQRIDSFPTLVELRGMGWQRGERPLGAGNG